MGNIKPKGFVEILAENPSLSRKMTYEEFLASETTGFDDSGIEEAYAAYLRVLGGSDEKDE